MGEIVGKIREIMGICEGNVGNSGENREYWGNCGENMEVVGKMGGNSNTKY